uniref:Uncharacterized protein n=1 Tax=Microviridae sp. ctuZ46 TaxID=2825010 RepID=A0A8S5UVS5_9VIRU|nr:MAG TPA: hypothetical protein [Microviridae sp. ctuZ46]
MQNSLLCGAQSPRVRSHKQREVGPTERVTSTQVVCDLSLFITIFFTLCAYILNIF